MKLLKSHLTFKQKRALSRGVIYESDYAIVLSWGAVRVFRQLDGCWQYGCVESSPSVCWPDKMLAILLAIRTNPQFVQVPHWGGIYPSIEEIYQ